MNCRFVIVLMFDLCFGVVYGQNNCANYDITQDVFEAEVEYTVDDAKKNWYTDSWASSVTTINKATYFVYVDSTLHAQVGKMENGQVVKVPLDNSHKVTDDGHNEFSLALDKEGYIHVMGNMHCDTLRYWRSKVPYNLTSGFQIIPKAIPSTFSYYFFRKTISGELFMAARTGSRVNWWGYGGRGVGLYYYNTTTKKWETRGEVPNGNTYKNIFWESGGKPGGYQMYKADFRFDKNDRLHFTVTVNMDTAQNTFNYAVYAYSDDYGITWKKADGTAILLPMRVAQMDVIDGYKNANMGEHSKIFLDFENQPAVMYSIDGKTFYRHLKENQWQPRKELVSNAQWPRAETLYDRWGTLMVVNGSSYIRFKDYGLSLKTGSLGHSVYRWDMEALQQEDTYRAINWNSKTGSWSIVRFDFNNPTKCKDLITGENTSDKELLAVFVYPNPNSGRFYLNLSEMKNTDLQILDAVGTLVYEGVHKGKTYISDLRISKGVYFLKAKVGEGYTVQKMIVE